MLKNKNKAIVFSILAMFLWGTAIPLIKSTYVEFGIGPSDTGLKILVAGVRFFMAGIITFILYELFGKKDRDKASLNQMDMKFVIALAISQTLLQYLFYYIGLSNTTGVKSSIIQASNAFIVVILSSFLLPNDKINPNIIIALILGTLGVIITSTGGPAESSGMKLNGEGFILVAQFLNALSTVLIRKYGTNEDPFLLTAMQFVIGSSGLIIIGLIAKEASLAFTGKGFLMLLYGAFVSAAAFSIWTLVLSYHSANEFSIYKLFIPIFGSILSVIFLGEAFTARLAIGMVLVLGGSLILNMSKREKVNQKGLLQKS